MITALSDLNSYRLPVGEYWCWPFHSGYAPQLVAADLDSPVVIGIQLPLGVATGHRWTARRSRHSGWRVRHASGPTSPGTLSLGSPAGRAYRSAAIPDLAPGFPCGTLTLTGCSWLILPTDAAAAVRGHANLGAKGLTGELEGANRGAGRG